MHLRRRQLLRAMRVDGLLISPSPYSPFPPLSLPLPVGSFLLSILTHVYHYFYLEHR